MKKSLFLCLIADVMSTRITRHNRLVLNESIGKRRENTSSQQLVHGK